MKNRTLQYLITGVIAILSLSACHRERTHPGRAYFPDMAASEAYEYYKPNPFFGDSATARVPVKGTIARGHEAYSYPKTFDGQVLAGKELTNPVQATAENLERGKTMYNIYCINCHGEQGKGDGNLYTSKKFTAKPTSLVDAFVQQKPDGEIFHVITMGSLSGLMGAHGSQISPRDRWMIVKYVKNEFSVTPK